jgi:predicted nucleic acid-binding Zn ribbon protein
MHLIGAGAGIIFKGSGFYETDYKKTKEAAGKPDSKTEAKPETKVETKSEAKSDTKGVARPAAASD